MKELWLLWFAVVYRSHNRSQKGAPELGSSLDACAPLLWPFKITLIYAWLIEAGPDTPIVDHDLYPKPYTTS